MSLKIPLCHNSSALRNIDAPLAALQETTGFSNDWNQPRPDPRLSEVDLADGRIVVPCFA
jgi:hypothetical protein